nr:phosphopantetheine-binding protein [Rhodococcus sp. (in: high G+C Gram-positive bacteria)]
MTIGLERTTDAAISAGTALSVSNAIDAVVEVLEQKNRDTHGVDADSVLLDLGLDSLDTAELFMALEDCSGCRLDPDSAADLRSVRDLTLLRPL